MTGQLLSSRVAMPIEEFQQRYQGRPRHAALYFSLKSQVQVQGFTFIYLSWAHPMALTALQPHAKTAFLHWKSPTHPRSFEPRTSATPHHYHYHYATASPTKKYLELLLPYPALWKKKSSSSNNNQTKDIKPSNSYQPTRRNVYLSFDTKFNPSHTPTPIKNRHFSNISTQDTTRHQPLLGEKPRELFESFRFFPYISSLQWQVSPSLSLSISSNCCVGSYPTFSPAHFIFPLHL